MEALALDLLSLRWQHWRERQSGRPHNRSLYDMLRMLVLEGSLTPGQRLPATRDLSRELELSRNTVTHAYDQLVAEGYLRALTGSGTYVSDSLPESALLARDVLSPMVARDRPPSSMALSLRGQNLVSSARASSPHWGAFVPGVPDVTAFPHEKFNQLLTRARRSLPPAWRSYNSGGGHPGLRQTLAAYLRQSRSVNCEPDQIVITEGIHQGIDLVSRLMTDPGDRVWVEEPGYWGLRSLLQINGLEPQGLPVDADGLVTSAADWQSPPRLIFVTPSHQYPLGSVMSLGRRLQLLDQAAKHGSWIIEDDYDSEFRYEGHPIPSLQGLVPDAPVIYAGTFSKTAFPALRLAYLVLPRTLADAFRRAYPQLYRQGQMSTQIAMAEFINQGYFGAHIRRMRLVYAERRQMLRHLILQRLGPGKIHPHDSTAGLHLVMNLPPGVSDHKVVQHSAEAGVVVRALSDYYLNPDCPQGLLLGFACVPRESMVPAFESLLSAIARSHTALGNEKST